MTVRGLRRIIVSVAELDPALHLYRDALGFVEQYRAGDVVMLQVPDGDLQLLLHQRPPTPGMAGVAAALLVDDVDAMTAAAERAGAIIAAPPADQPWGERQSVLTDPDGHVLCLVSPANG
ncbi:VOC family protein [Paractinoplanes rishiriensis]|uniref:VOC domain-containing protein n=1 Tax=Paractinoplanes rishiriensis TaxID=1050105 RepID=A0A919JX09_9ACTN|nr:VOC family protein [Actinoplanes rishiriensis]GIE95174.1 hypothetical protein Ari01nite_26390 [Actinoplanes rishiriensis]